MQMGSLVGVPGLGIRVRVVPEIAPSMLLLRGRMLRSFRVCASSSSPPSSTESIRVRFAPSPTGNLHVGGARTALFNYLFARSKGGKFVLRIEDTDLERSTKESEEALLRDLSWLGLDWDEGPGVGGNYGPYRQSERNALYKQYADKLLRTGHVYRCFCSNEELEKMKENAKMKQLPPVYTGKWASATEMEMQEELAKGTPYTYRFRVPKTGNLKIDDLIRGEALGLPMPRFAHGSLILAPDRSKLSKRHGATSVGQLVSFNGLILLDTSTYTFDNARWMNGQHLRSLPSEKLTKLIGERWKSTGIVTESSGSFVEEAVQLLKDGIDLIPDADTALSSLLSYPLYKTLTSPESKPVLEDKLSEVAASLLIAYDSGEFSSALEEGNAGWQKWVKSFGKSLKRKGKSLFMPLRVLLTGKLHGPDMGAGLLLVFKAGKCGVVAPQCGLVTLDERFKILREVEWESLNRDNPTIEPASTVVATTGGEGQWFETFDRLSSCRNACSVADLTKSGE
ncbi:hypothetical protein DH2020_036802 [Rehmannia glutinosa]|uniref:Glutamyl-tRNA synthetase n=1 Tax=Rehmannia glutinosa TaxID=99300 RepID=A0ABR0V4E9_REHGL